MDINFMFKIKKNYTKSAETILNKNVEKINKQLYVEFKKKILDEMVLQSVST